MYGAHFGSDFNEIDKVSMSHMFQLKLQFMPRSMGTFSQYWDIQTTGNTTSSSQREESIRVHLTGEVCRHYLHILVMAGCWNFGKGRECKSSNTLKRGICFFQKTLTILRQ